MTDPTPISADESARRLARHNVFVLAGCQALSMSGAVLTIAVSALAGQALAEDKSLATLPFALQFVMTMVSTIPASLLMGKIGRRAGFTVGQIIGILGGLIAAFGLFENSFVIFAVGSAVIGIHNAFWSYLRFAAADIADDDFRSKAISYVMAGGLVAAFAGPEIAKATRSLFEPVVFAGSYLALAGLCVLNIGLLRLVNIPRPPAAGMGGRRMRQIVSSPVFLVAVAAAMIGYAAMNLIMSATPLAMHAAHFGFSDSAFVIQWHVLGMFAPSFVTGHLIRRYAAPRVIVGGTLGMMAAVGVNLSGDTLWHYWAGLVLLGVGWNFMYIGGTALLTECYRPEERARVQAVNDFLVFVGVSASSLTSGVVQHALGWAAVNLGVVLPILAVFAVVVRLLLLDRSAAGKGS